jgi:Na+/proline symporter
MVLQEASNYLAPQVAALYLLSILWGRANETGAFYGLSLGFALGLTRLVASMLTLHTMQVTSIVLKPNIRIR